MYCFSNCLLRAARQGGYLRPARRNVQVKVFRYCPCVVFPQCATRSISMNPGCSWFHSVKIRTAIDFLSGLPGLVVLKPCGDLIRIGPKQRSMLAELIFKSRSFVSLESSISLQRSNTRMASGKTVADVWNRSVHRSPRSARAPAPLHYDRWFCSFWFSFSGDFELELGFSAPGSHVSDDIQWQT